MEELLAKIIEKGWKPRGENVELNGTSEDTFGEKVVIFNGNAGGFKKWGCTYRELVSKESGLRQFCAENRLINPDDNYIRKWEQQCRYVYDDYDCWEKSQLYSDDYDYQYRIIESALKDESELEAFLIENIKV